MAFRVPGFTVYERLGVGARSTIWLVESQSTGEQFALKRVMRRSSEDDRFVEQAINDYEVSSQVRHPVLRRSFEVTRVRRLLQLREVHILMELVHGRTLDEIGPKSPLPELVRAFIQVARGLDALHQQHYVHGDTKPNNILITPQGDVKVIDFGQSCPIGHVKDRIQGTPDYIAPEQIEKGVPLTQRTDVFNLGATLYWAVTGRAYPTVMPRQKRQGGIDLVGPREAPPPEEVNPAVPIALSRLIMDCCRENPKDRPTEMQEVIRRLEVTQHLLDRAGETPDAGNAEEENTAPTIPGLLPLDPDLLSLDPGL
ncbi:MAG TPA: serine/threonine-protein kinase [Phycisphaerae bacterium]|nr:serine/threonine-protein kinase [Phycisphaerae bacterium]